MERIVLTWGLIPNDNSSQMIYCGDAETSETLELNFKIIGDAFKDHQYWCYLLKVF
jgi:hypothetical protein